MRRIGQWLGIFIVVLLANGRALADTENSTASGNPYSAIVDRNIFSLVPMPTNDPTANTKPPEPPAKITPNGIMTIFGQVQALFKVATPTKPGAPAQDQSYVLSVGERQNDIEVTKIDESARIITFNNHGIIQELSLTNATITGPAPPVAGSSGVHPGFAPPPGSPAAQFAASHNLGNPAVNNPNAFNPNAANPNMSMSPNYGANSSQSIQHLSPEAQVLAIEAQREQWKQQGNPAAVILPPTVMSQQAQGESGGSPGP